MHSSKPLQREQGGNSSTGTMGQVNIGNYYAGLDIGSTMSKVVILGEGTEYRLIKPTGPEHRKLANLVMEEALGSLGMDFEAVTYIVATGYGRVNVPFADKQVTEITCHAKGLACLLPGVKTVIDIGGQDSKAIRLENGKVVDFAMNDKCAAGSGRFLEIIADTLGVPLERMGELSLQANRPASIGNTCTVFAQQEVISHLAAGESIPNLIAGIHQAVATRIHAMVSKLKIEREVAITGGGAKNQGLVKALEAKLGFAVLIPQEPLITGALGAALIAREMWQHAAQQGHALTRKPRRLSEATLF